VWWRNVVGLSRLWWLPVHLAVVLAKAARRAWEGQLGPFVRGRLAAAGLMGQIGTNGANGADT
jgi:hypothetical protein